MTLLDSQPAAGASARPRREAYRDELAALLHRDPSALPDQALLLEDLALDSLAMMSVLTWLDSHGVAIDAVQDRPASVGAVLSLAERAGRSPGLSIRVTDPAAGVPFGPADIATWRRPAADPLAPVLDDQAVRLVPVAADDLGFLYSLAIRPETCFRWRYRGAPPSFDRFVDDLWRQVLVQLVAKSTADNQPVGHVVAYGADPAMRHLYVGAVFLPPFAGTGLAARAVGMFMRYLFHTFPLHKIYLEVPGFNWSQVSSGQEHAFQVEGVLRDHDHYAGRTWDQYLCAVYRNQPERSDP
jgi:RimJ/RimL family protein N-acetyltransferase/aryl carrier-like protein